MVPVPGKTDRDQYFPFRTDNINRMVYLLQRDPEALAEKQSEGSEDRREGFYPWNAIMGSSGHSAYSVRNRKNRQGYGTFLRG